MCRLLAYIGHPALVADVVLWPDRSIIKQSYDARERIQDPSLPFHLGFGNLNGDGFGIGWFNPNELQLWDPTPCMFKSVTPAWNNENLARLACKIVSPVIFAHVRAAYPGMPVSEQNCHPFQWGRYLWMHNGVVGGFNIVKRALLATLSDAAFNSIQSFHSDSAVAFAIFLSHLPDVEAQHPPDVLLRAMQDTVSTICHVQEVFGVTETSLLNFVVSDGSTLVATRFVNPPGSQAATLYYAEGSSWERRMNAARQPSGPVPSPQAAPASTTAAAAPAAPAGGDSDPLLSSLPSRPGTAGGGCQAAASSSHALVGSSVLQEASYSVTYGERGAGVVLVASEPITGSTTDWVSVAINTALVITREKGGYLNIMRSSLSPSAPDPIQAEVATCLEAISRGLSSKSAPWLAKRPSLKGGPSFLEEHFSEESVYGELLHTDEEHLLTGHTGPVLALALDAKAQRLYSAGMDCSVRVWDLTTSTCLHVLSGHNKPVTQVQLVGDKLYTAAGGAIKVWCTRTFDGVDRIKTSFYSGGIRSMLVTPDGTIFVGHHSVIKRYSPSSTPQAHGRCPTPLPPSPGHLSVRTPDAETCSASSHVGPVNCLTLAGPYLCSAGGDAMVRVWRASDLTLLRVLRGHRGAVLCLVALGNLLLSGARDNAIRVWDLDMGMCRRTLLGHKDDVLGLTAIALRHIPATPDTALGAALGSSPAGNGAAGGSPFGSARSGGPPLSPRGMTSLRGSAASTPPGGVTCLVASASADSTIRIWSTSWVCLRVLTINPGAHGMPMWDGFSSSSMSQQPPQQQQQQQASPGAQLTVAQAAAAALQPSAVGARQGSLNGAPAASEAFGSSSSMHRSGQLGCSGSLPSSFQRSWDPAGAFSRSSTIGRTGSSTAAQQYHSPAAFTVVMSKNLVAAGYSDGCVRMWSTDELLAADVLQQLSGMLDGGDMLLQRQLSAGLLQLVSPPVSPRMSLAGGPGLSTAPNVSGTSVAAAMAAAAAAVEGAPRGNPCARIFWRELRCPHGTPVNSSCLQCAEGELAGVWQPGCGNLGISSSSISTGQAAAAGGQEPQQQEQEQPQDVTEKQGWNTFLHSVEKDQAGNGSSSSSSGDTTDPSKQQQQEQGQQEEGDQEAKQAHPVVERGGSGVLAMVAEACAVKVAAAALITGSNTSSVALPSTDSCDSSAAANWAAAAPGVASNGGVAAAAAAASNLCPACGSQDLQLVRSLREFVGIKTVSADQKLRDECLRGAKFLARLLEGLGAEVKMSQCVEGKNPVVLGRLGNNPAHPTVVFYGHYDVQPAEEPDWRTAPWTLCAVDGYLCGRGTSDNKGPILAFVYAIKEMLDCWQVAGASAPINFAFMFEGEEENGSIGFREAVASNLGWFADAALVVISNTVWVGEKQPCLTYGMRGMITASIQVSGPDRDVHSGNDGGVFDEPMVDLAKLVATFTAPGGRITVPGFYHEVRPHLMDLAWQGLERSEEFSLEEYREAIGVPKLTAPPNKHDLLQTRWCQPSLSIVDVRTDDPLFNPPPSPDSSSRAPSPITQQHQLLPPPAFRAGNGDRGGSGRCGVQWGAASPSSPGQCPHHQHHHLPAPRCVPARGGHAVAPSSYRFGPTRFSVIPRSAVAKVSIRFVPEQDAARLVEALREDNGQGYGKLGSAHKVELLVHSIGDWWEADPESKLFKMAERAVAREWGTPPLYVREGGTMPVASLIEKLLGAPALMVPLGQSSDNCHLANERLRQVNLIKGKNVIRNILEELAVAAAPAGVPGAGAAARGGAAGGRAGGAGVGPGPSQQQQGLAPVATAAAGGSSSSSGVVASSTPRAVADSPRVSVGGGAGLVAGVAQEVEKADSPQPPLTSWAPPGTSPTIDVDGL